MKGCIVAVHFDFVPKHTLATEYVGEDEGVTTYPDNDVWEKVKRVFGGPLARICVERNPNGMPDAESAYVEMRNGEHQSHIPAGTKIVRVWRCTMVGEQSDPSRLLDAPQ